MEAILVTVFCLALFLFMRGVSSTLGDGLGTAAGIGCLGLIGFGIVCALVILLLPVLLPIALFILICYVIIRIAMNMARNDQ